MLLLLFWRSLSLPPLLRVWLVAPVFVLPALFSRRVGNCSGSRGLEAPKARDLSAVRSRVNDAALIVYCLDLVH